MANDTLDGAPHVGEATSAVLDEKHVGDIRGALGTIRLQDTGTRRGWGARLLTLAAIVGPGIIVMVGDNDAGGVATYSQAGQNYGTSLLWVLPLLIPVLIVNQEMVVRLGAVTGVGHARLIKERFGRFWGLFSVGNLLVLDFLTIVTEFIGVDLALGYFGVSKYVSVPAAALGLVAITASGSFRRWERFMLPRYINYERADTVLGSFVTVVGACLMVVTCAFAFSHTAYLHHFTDAGGVARDLGRRLGHAAGTLYALVLLNASIIGAAAVTLGTSYAFGDFFGAHHSLHRSFFQAKGFYASFAGLVAVAGAIVLIPHAPLGLITVGVQALAGVLLPSAAVFLLLLCNDRAVLGPWCNRLWLNAVTTLVIGILIVMSLILVVTTVVPAVDVTLLALVLAVLLVAVLAVVGVVVARRRPPAVPAAAPLPRAYREGWRMPPLALLGRPEWSRGRVLAMRAMSGYLVIAVLLLLVKAIELGSTH